MKFLPTPLTGSYLIELDPKTDDRGTFTRLFCKSNFADIGFDKEIKQVNHSLTKSKHAIRGMHYRLAPYDECKFLKCIHGRIYDVIIDLRKGSPTFLQYFSIELSSKKDQLLFMPEGFAHGFQALEADSEVIYFHTNEYHPDYETGIRYNDPLIHIKWPYAVSDISEKDANQPSLDLSFSGILVSS